MGMLEGLRLPAGPPPPPLAAPHPARPRADERRPNGHHQPDEVVHAGPGRDQRNHREDVGAQRANQRGQEGGGMRPPWQENNNNMNGRGGGGGGAGGRGARGGRGRGGHQDRRRGAQQGGNHNPEAGDLNGDNGLPPDRGGGGGGGRGGGNGPAGSRQQPREIGYKKLVELAEDDGVLIMQKLSDDALLAMFERLTREKQLGADWVRLVVKILAKMCRVEYQPIIMRVFGRACQREFLDQLLMHIVTLNVDANRERRDGLADFYRNFCVLADGLLSRSPHLACEKLGNLVKKASSELRDLPEFEGSSDIQKELASIQEKLQLEQERLEKTQGARQAGETHRGRFGADGPDQQQRPPPDPFRDLPDFPTLDDILIPYKPYLRKSIVRGPYDDAEHYLDVQFRLLREDFVRPLRDGIREYCDKVREQQAANANDPNDAKKKKKKAIKVNNVRVYDKVVALGVKAEDDKIGLALCFDPDKKFASSINWEYSKRLMNGALLLLSRDLTFTSLVLATVSRRDLKELTEGRIVVELCEGPVRKDLFNGHFLMVECQVFFGAYSHVLRALKAFDEHSLPMRDYIVYASRERRLPDYLQRSLEDDPGAPFAVPMSSANPASFDDSFQVSVEDPRSWPSAERLGLDESQFRALSGAITNKLMLIQGPPGTGKTFLGLKVATSLLLNRHLWMSSREPRPMLVVCYTNHALDQFLAGLLPATQSMVRVGGGCKDPRLEQFGINQLRRTRLRGQGQLYARVREQRDRFQLVKALSDRFRHCHARLRDNAGVLAAATLRRHGLISDAELQQLDPKRGGWSMLRWLLAFDGWDVWMRNFEGRGREGGDENGGGDGDGGIYRETIFDPDDCNFSPIQEEHDEQQARGGWRPVELDVSLDKMESHARLLREGGDERSAQYLDRVAEALRAQLGAMEALPPRDFEDRRGLGRLRFLQPVVRWQLYRYWKERLLAAFDPVIDRIDVAYGEAAELLQEWRMVEDQSIMANNLVIGMTTTYAASRQRILKELKPRIVIVEEAAEVLEAHVLVSLAGEVEHLVMIGDHQQLRPNPAVYELAVKYHLDVSLFERLINNGVHCVTLSTQHRMRPEIARLVSPVIYPDLQNDASVYSFPDVRGVGKNVFFVDHDHPEEQVKDAQSYQNIHEAKFLSSLVRHLLLQGYEPSQITVLSTYKGQQYCFSKLRQHEAHLKEVRITVVDNYQGEEADVILLSLVRSNAEDAVGFLKTENRVCVALSRARHGLFVVGNMRCMAKAEASVWRKVRAELELQGALGAALPLRCAIHDTRTDVASAEDFAACPQGGCLRLCGVLLGCGHPCRQVCHTLDREHKNFKCTAPCPKLLCPSRHPCPDRCFEPCGPCMVPKVEELPCGHSAEMPCHRDPRDHKCKVRVECTLPACGHRREAYCHQKTDNLAGLACKEPCVVRMDCGHTCGKTCHVLDDPQHLEFKCFKPCGEVKTGCSTREHKCGKLCYEVPCEECSVEVEKRLPCDHRARMQCKEPAEAFVCKRKCARTKACGHPCPRLCHQDCDPCPVKVSKTVPRCAHDQVMECGLDPALFTGCKAACERTLPGCGHRCKRKCKDVCAEHPCKELVEFAAGPAACGHRVKVPCHKRGSYDRASRELLLLCAEPCGQVLECGHKCGGTCGGCLQGRLHVACGSKCERTLVCGHLCKEPCAASCPPCKMGCSVRCQHSECKKRCGEPCNPCQEPCPRRCPHARCPAACGELCPVEPCNEPCDKKLPGCGHDCVGLCGDTCLCRECNDDKIDIFFGTEDDEDARFVKLPDCSHIFESSGLDRWMLGDGDENGDQEISKKCCPQCKSDVSKSQRYSNVLKQIAKDVSAVKAEVYGNWRTIKPAALEARETLDAVPSFPAGFHTAAELLSKLTAELQKVEKRLPHGNMQLRRKPRASPLSLTELKNLQAYVQLVANLAKIAVESTGDDAKLGEKGKAEVRDFVEAICGNLQRRDFVRMSQQEAADVNMEMRRLRRLMQLCQVENGPAFRNLKPSEKEMYWTVSELIRGIAPYVERRDGEVEEKLAVLAKATSVLITREEIAAVVAALGMAQGRWFKCRNGHPYVITECGGAMQESRCPECGAGIGGSNHQLRRDNQLATEIDGATAPLYPTMMQYGY